MAKFLPFKAIRPSKDKVHLVASRSYVSYTKTALFNKLTENIFSFIHIINPEFGKQASTRANTKARFTKVKLRFREFLDQGVYHQDKKPAFYIYRQTQKNHTFTGIIGAIAADDYLNGNIKIHEQTLKKREHMFKEYLKTTFFNAEPVLMTYPDQPGIQDIVNSKIQKRSEYNFTNTDGIQHELWLIKNKTKIINLINQFKLVKCTYIADGHHRSASSALLAQECRYQYKNATEAAGFNYFMAYLVPESELAIYEFNRSIKGLNNHTEEEILDKLTSNFKVEKTSECVSPSTKGQFSMYLNSNWYTLMLKKKKSIENELDTTTLNRLVLTPILGIRDFRTDKRMHYIGGVHGSSPLQKMVDKKETDISFMLYPVQISELKYVADNNGSMPPKSTWIEPKLRSGLTIYNMDDEINI